MDIRKEIETIFAKDLLELSPKAAEFIDIAWFVSKIGNTPLSLLSMHYDNAEEKMQALANISILKWFAKGVVKKGEKKNITFVSINETLSGLSKELFKKIFIAGYGSEIFKFCRTNLTNCLTTLLAAIIIYATPEKPAYLNKVIRIASKEEGMPISKCKELTEFYLEKYLNLVKIKNSSINLSEKAMERIKNKELWKIYSEKQA